MDERAAGPERDPRFPGGAWTGFFLQSWLPGRQPTDLILTWCDGVVEGSGSDWVGPYTVAGEYDVLTGRCGWVKQYVGRHAVSYRGTADAGGVWGVWEIRQFGGLYVDRGGFHLWPAESGPPPDADRTERAVVELMRTECRHPFVPLGRVLVVVAAVAAVGGLVWWLAGY
jgi:hypothetical protein